MVLMVTHIVDSAEPNHYDFSRVLLAILYVFEHVKEIIFYQYAKILIPC